MSEPHVEQHPGTSPPLPGKRPWRFRAATILITAGLAAAFLPSVLSGNAQAAEAFSTTIINQANGNCVDVPNGAGTNALQLVQWTCSPGAKQSFSFAAVAGQTETYTVDTVTAVAASTSSARPARTTPH